MKTATPNDTNTFSSSPDISKRARELWEGYGRPKGRDQEIWFKAERQLRGSIQRMSGNDGDSVSAHACDEAISQREASHLA